MTTYRHYLFCRLLFSCALHAEPATSYLAHHEWQHNGTEGDSVRLHPKKGEAWSEGWVHFAEPIDVDARGLTLTFNMQTDRARGEDIGAVYAKLQFTNDPSRREQVSINATARPSDRWYMLYVDPGWQIPNRHYLTPQPPPGLFATPETIERFRLTVSREGNSIIATFSHWNVQEKRWRRLAMADGRYQVVASLADDLEGQTSVKSLSFQFPGDASALSGIALESASSTIDSR